MITFAQRLIPWSKYRIDRNTHVGRFKRKTIGITKFVRLSNFILNLCEILQLYTSSSYFLFRIPQEFHNSVAFIRCVYVLQRTGFVYFK